MRRKKKVIFIASTGGHLSELLCLEELIRKYDSLLMTEKTKSNLNLNQRFDKVAFLVSGTMSNPFLYPFKLIINSFISLFQFIKFFPDVVISTGAHNAGPMCCIAKLFRKKVVFIESYANCYTKSVTGKIIYKFADLFIVQWEDMKKLYPNAKFCGGIF